jgi:phosphoribosylamine---glycine ligase
VKILVIGGGGTEHALIWKLSRSKHITKVYCSPGNAGIAEIAECIDVSPQNVDALMDFVKYEWIDLTIVCSQTLLDQSIVDTFDRHGCKLFGLNRGALALGTGRVSLKDFMKRYRIPTAEYRVFSSHLLAQDYIQMKGLPLVIKTNGYPGEKGVFHVLTVEEAAGTLKHIMKEKAYGDNGNQIIIEEHLQGKRMSLVTITDGKTILPLASLCKYRGIPSKDRCSDVTVYGSFNPASFMTREIEMNIVEKVIYPVHRALNTEGIFFRGFISADLIVQKSGIYLSELLFGFGDLETQLIMPGIKADIGELILSASEGRLSDIQIKEDKPMSVCIALFSEKKRAMGTTGFKINGLDAIKKMAGVFLFHENTIFEQRDIVTPGGMAMHITATGADLKEAQMRVYSAAEKIYFDGMQYRKDISMKIKEGGENI